MAENGVPKKMGLNIDLNSPAPLEEDAQDQVTSKPLPLPIQYLLEQQRAAVGLASLGRTIGEPMELKNAEMVNVKFPQQTENVTSNILLLQQQIRAKVIEQQRAAVGSAPLGGSLTIREPGEPKNAEMFNVKFPQHGEYKSGITALPQISESAKAALRKRLEKVEDTRMTPSVNVTVSESEKTVVPSMPPPVPQAKELGLTCPICMGKLVEETSTICGHIFCKSCINAALAAQRKCPTCRRKLRLNATFRIYLPTASN